MGWGQYEDSTWQHVRMCRCLYICIEVYSMYSICYSVLCKVHYVIIILPSCVNNNILFV